MKLMRLLAALSAAATLACGGDDTTNPGDGGGNGSTVSVVNNSFSPASIDVTAGSPVTWQWNSGGVTHNVTFEDAAPGSGDRSSGSFSRTFTATGDYVYFCSIHVTQGMTGVVSVTAAATGGTGNGGTGGTGGGGGGSYP